MTYFLLVEIAWKSVVTSGIALLLLSLLGKRSAAERSWVAHAGLIATLLLPLAVIALPSWKVAAPAVLPKLLVEAEAPALAASAAADVSLSAVAAAPEAGFDLAATSLWLYGLPAALLLLITFVAILRLFALRRRATVLVEQTWLSALAHAQRRMGFKHGTALLVSTELSSPVSWGILRPIIVLNEEAIASHGEAEAIIAHELAHVARLDWAKLLIARAATALFWFNPLVWMLARHCHQLREEAADDAVLGSDVPGVDYAALLVGAARHESKSMLLAANGVAPGGGSLKRRVTRVLDAGLRRAPARAAWVSACSVGAILISAPLSALSPVTPIPPALAADPSLPTPIAAIAAMGAAAAAAELPEAEAVAAEAVAAETTATLATEAAVDAIADRAVDKAVDAPARGEPAATGDLVGNIVTNVVSNVVPNVVANATASALAMATASADRRSAQSISGARRLTPDELVSMRIHGVTPEFARQLAAANPAYARLTTDQLVALRIHGVDAADVRAFAEAGYPNLSHGELVAMSIHGVSPSFIRELSSLGYRRLSVNQLTTMRIHGVSPAYIREFRAEGYDDLGVEELVKMRIFGVKAPKKTPKASAEARAFADDP